MSEVVSNCKFICFSFFKEKTAYEITYGDWSSDVCSSDLGTNPAWYLAAFKQIGPHAAVIVPQRGEPLLVMTPAWDAPRYRERATMEFVAVAPERFLDAVAAELRRRDF